jgi:HEAT repeat protein
MMRVREQLGQLAQRVTGADSPAALRRIVAEILRIEDDWSGGDELDQLRLQAFESLMGFTEQEREAARDALLNDLLPLCLRTKDEWKGRGVARRYDEILKDWLARFPASASFVTREALLTRLVAALDGRTAEKACRLIGMLGYRDERAFGHLLDLAHTGADSIPDVALHVLTVLGVPPSRHTEVVRLWLERAGAVPWNHDLIGAAKQLASGEILGFVFDRWLTPGNLSAPVAARNLLPHLAIAIPPAIAEQFPGDAALQDQVWDRLRALESLAPDLFFQRVLGSTQVAHPCDSPGVVRYYLSAFAGKPRARDLAYFRLEECDRPRQQLGWQEDPGQEVVGTVLEDAGAATTMTGSFMTQDLRRKLQAWETLLCLGRGEALAGVGAAIAGERNGHAIGAVLDLAACFKLDPVPPRVRDLIAGQFGDIAEDDSERVSSHVAAIAVARSSGSRSGFEALLGFNLIRQGGVLISLLDALADTVAALRQAGDASAVGRLWQAAAPGQPEHRRAAAAATLGRLLRRNLLQPLPVDRVTGLVEDESLDPYARREVLESLGHVPADEALPQIERVLRRALDHPPTAPGGSADTHGADFRPVALAALARLGLLTSHPDTLRQHLGLRHEGGTWMWERRPSLPGASVVVGTLYGQEPDKFAPPVADLLRDGDWTLVVQLAPFLRAGPRPAPEPIVGAVLGRVRRAGSEIGEPDLIPLLADLAPGRLASESWSGMFGWPPQVRAALAEALARHPSPDDLDRCMNLLLVLMGDGQYGVRRAAFKATGRLSPDRLRSVCTAWALLTESSVQPAERPYAIDMRRRAAEAAAWLEPFPIEGPIADLASDPEPEVRATFARCRRERRERDWATVYVRNVLAACEDASVLTAWKYGRALERVGDDEALERLEQRRRGELAPGVRHWLGRLIKKLRTRWDEVTRGWPEPWFARRGRLERVDALVGDDEARARRVSCWLWQVPPTDLVEFGVWGGWCAEESLPVEMHTLRVSGRRPATILVTTATRGTGPTYFTGSGPYPELVP